jgi:anti-sigma factor RsiW
VGSSSGNDEEKKESSVPGYGIFSGVGGTKAMQCDKAQLQIVAFIHGELDEASSAELEQHTRSCERCRAEREIYQALHRALALAPVEDPSPNLLTQSRIRLDQALDQMGAPSLWLRLQTGTLGLFAQLSSAPGVAAALAVTGFLLGGLAGQVWMHHNAHASTVQVAQLAQNAPLARPVSQTPATLALPAQGMPSGAIGSASGGAIEDASTGSTATSAAPAAVPQIFNVSRIVPHADTHMVEVQYNQIVPKTMEGPMDDPAVQQLLLMAAGNGMDPGVQDDSVALLAQQCSQGRYCAGGPVRTALMVALRYDRDASVRAKALDGLQPYVAEDTRVRDAILESLLHDPSLQVRSSALHVLEPVEADSSVHMVLETLAQQDPSPQIRAASAQAVLQMPPIQ